MNYLEEFEEEVVIGIKNRKEILKKLNKKGVTQGEYIDTVLNEPGNEFAEAIWVVFDREYESDSEKIERKFRHIARSYKDANDKGKEIIDNVLIDLCGWSLNTLFKKTVELIDVESSDGFEECDNVQCEFSYCEGLCSYGGTAKINPNTDNCPTFEPKSEEK